VLIDEQCASTVPGLYAAGDSSDQCRCVAMAVTSGYLSGKAAAKFAADVKTHATPDQKVIDSGQYPVAKAAFAKPGDYSKMGLTG